MSDNCDCDHDHDDDEKDDETESEEENHQKTVSMSASAGMMGADGMVAVEIECGEDEDVHEELLETAELASIIAEGLADEDSDMEEELRHYK